MIGSFLGQTIGPIIGGLLNQFLGWRSIFWFLVIFSGAIFLTFLIFFPETCRAVVGNGTIPAQKWNMSLSQARPRPQFLPRNANCQTYNPAVRAARRPMNLLGMFQVMFSKEGGWILLYSGFLFGGFYTIIAAIPTEFARNLHLNAFQIGLCYIPFGFGCMVAAIATGKTVDWNFRRLAKQLNHPLTSGQQNLLGNYPIEKARLQVAIPLVCLGFTTIIIYGWVLTTTTSLAGPIILLFFLGFSLCGAYSALSTLLGDIFPEKPGSATAAANMARCWMGAAAVAGIGPLLDKVGPGWANVVVAGIWLCASPLLWVVWRFGPRWREEKRVKAEREVMGSGEEGGY